MKILEATAEVVAVAELFIAALHGKGRVGARRRYVPTDLIDDLRRAIESLHASRGQPNRLRELSRRLKP